MFRKTFISRDSQLWKRLYTSLVRLHLEYAVQVWNPYLEGDISSIENFQERAIRIPYTSLRGLTDYESRHDSWGLTKLEDRRIREALILMYKNLNNFEAISFISNPKDNFSKNLNEKRRNVGNSMRMMRESFKAKDKNDNCHKVTVRTSTLRTKSYNIGMNCQTLL